MGLSQCSKAPRVVSKRPSSEWRSRRGGHSQHEESWSKVIQGGAGRTAQTLSLARSAAVAAALECSNSCPPREAFLKMGKSVEKGVDRKTHILRVAYLPYHAVEAFPAFLDPTYSSSLLGAMSISIMNVSDPSGVKVLKMCT